MRRFLAVAVLVAVSFGSVARAQEATPVPIDFPLVGQLGPDWSFAGGAPITDFNADVFSDVSTAVYTGPNGARILAILYFSKPGRVATQRSWEIASKDFDDLRSSFRIYYNADQDKIDSWPLPSGCVDVRRAEGSDPVFAIPVGITQCAADPNAIVLVASSGTVNGIEAAFASDWVASLMVTGGNSN